MKKEPPTALGRFVLEQRTLRGWTQKELAAESGVPQATISDIERGSNKLPGAEYRRALALALGVRHVDLLVAAGELRADELPKEGAPREPFNRNDPRLEVLGLLERVRMTPEREFALKETLNRMIEFDATH